MIVARPNQSATWRGNLLLLLALAVPTLGVAAGTQLTSHPFNWSGVQVMTNYKLKF